MNKTQSTGGRSPGIMIFEQGDEVRVDIPDRTDPDFEQYHRNNGIIVDTAQDDAGEETGDDRDSVIYRVEFSDSSVRNFRWRDLRPVSE